MVVASVMQAAQRVVIDLAFEGKMTETEVSGVCSALDWPEPAGFQGGPTHCDAVSSIVTSCFKCASSS